MEQFLVDVNLPYYFNLWNNENFIHQADISNTATDEEIWNYAKTHNLTIITKDSDFSNRIMFTEPPPKIIHIKIGNMKIKDLHNFLNSVWEDVLNMNKSFKLVNVFTDRLEGIN